MTGSNVQPVRPSPSAPARSKPEFQLPSAVSTPFLLGAGAGAVYLGLGAAAGAVGLSAVLAASGAVAAVSAIASSTRKVPQVGGPLPLPPGFRRSSIVKKIDQSILNAAGGPALQAKALLEKAGNLVRSRRSVRSYVDPKSNDAGAGSAPTMGSFAVSTLHKTELATVESSAVRAASYAFSKDGARESSLDVGESDADAEPVIEADAFQVNPTIPAIFTIPVVGTLLNVLDGVAFGLEQVVTRVARRASAAGLPLVGRLASGERNEDGWELHRSFGETGL